MLHEVLRRFSAEGRALKVGDLVETSGWRNERLLLEHRFIGKPSAPPQQIASPVLTVREEAVAERTVEAVLPEQPAANPELPKALQQPPRPKPVPVVGRVPVAKAKE